MPNKGILKASDGEQWMYFLGQFGSDTQEGSLAKQNSEVKISLNGEINPIILTNEENDDLIQLLLPIKTY